MPTLEPVGMDYTVLLYDNLGRRKRLSQRLVGALSWTIEPGGGYADASLTLSGSNDEGAEAVTPGDRIDAYKFGFLQYRGYVSEVSISEEEPTSLDVSLYGRAIDLTQMLLSATYNYPGRVDVSIPFAEISQKIRARYPDIIVRSEVIGATVESLDCDKKTVKEALDSLLDFAQSRAIWGFDVDPESGRDRLYLRKISTSSVADHVVAVPGRAVGKREGKRSAVDIVNVVTVDGGDPAYPQMLPNGSFETLVRAGEAGGNLVDNPGFEAGSDYWSFSGGAVVVDSAESYAGERCAALSVTGATASQTVQTPFVALVEGRDYTFTFHARPMPDANLGTPPQARGRLFWRDAGGELSFAGLVLITPSTMTYALGELVSRCPAGATGFKVEISHVGGSSGSNAGLLIDEVTVADQGRLIAQGWGIRRYGDAQVLGLSWASGGAWHGRNCLYIDAIAHDEDNRDLHIRLTPSYIFDVIGGETYCFSAREKSSGPVAVPKHFYDFRWLRADGSEITTTHIPHVAGAPYDAWTYVGKVATAPADAVKCEAWITLRGAGQFYLDALSFRSSADGETIFLPPGEPLSATFAASDLVSAGENADVHNSATTWGIREKAVSAGDITTIADLRAWAREYLLVNASSRPAPTIELYDKTGVWVGQQIRLEGRDGERFSDGEMLPIMRIQGELGGEAALLTHTLELTRPVPTEEELYAKQAKDAAQKASVIGASAAQGATNPAGGTGLLSAVTSVGLSMPSGFSVGSSPVTSSGTIAVTTGLSGMLKGTGTGFATATPGTDFAAASHVHSAGDITTGTLAIGRGGSGSSTYTAGSLLKVHASGAFFTSASPGADYLAPISGAANQTLRFSGTNTLAAATNLVNDGTTVSVTGPLTVGGLATFGAKLNAQNNLLFFGQNNAVPGNSSTGEKIQFYSVTPGAVRSDDYAMGVSPGALWFNTNDSFKFNVASNLKLTIDSYGNLLPVGSIQRPSAVILQSTGGTYGLEQVAILAESSCAGVQVYSNDIAVTDVSLGYYDGDTGEEAFVNMRAEGRNAYRLSDTPAYEAEIQFGNLPGGGDLSQLMLRMNTARAQFKGSVQPLGGYKSVDGTAGASSTTGGAVFKNGLYVSGSISAGAASAAGATGNIQYNAGSSAFAGSNNLFWDATNSRLGIGTTTPGSGFGLTAPLHVKNASGAAILVEDTGGGYAALCAKGVSEADLILTHTAAAAGAQAFYFRVKSGNFDIINLSDDLGSINNYIYSATATGKFSLGFGSGNTTTFPGVMSIGSILGLPNLVVKAATSQTADLQQWRNVSDTPLAKVTVSGIAQFAGYKSADGTSGASATTGGATFKDGLFTGGTIASGATETNNVTVRSVAGADGATGASFTITATDELIFVQTGALLSG